MLEIQATKCDENDKAATLSPLYDVRSQMLWNVSIALAVAMLLP
jgi:hypothetical protein